MSWLLIVLIGGAWAAQTWFAWRQSQVFMAEVRRLRRRGRVAVGRAGPRRFGRAAFAAVAADSSDRVVEVVALTGITVWARPRTVAVWDGEPLAALRAVDEDADRVTRAASEAVRALLAPTREGPPGEGSADDELVAEDGSPAADLRVATSEHRG